MFSVLSFFKRQLKARQTEVPSSTVRPAETRKFIGSPLFNVLLMVSLMLSVSAIFRFLEWRRMNAQTQIQFNDSEGVAADEKAKNKIARHAADIFGGEVAHTSSRLRETGAFGFAVCLSILDEAQKRKQIPGSINGLINAVVSRNLMLPGISIENGEIQSNTSKIYLRFQPRPLQLEFVSLPKDESFGPALMLRFPLSSTDGKNIAYFQSSSVGNINLPPPFIPASEVIRSGWTQEVWRISEIAGGNQDFAQMLAEEQENLKKIAHDNSDYSAR